VSYNVLVHGDSSTSTVLVTARWIVVDGRGSAVCSTRGKWELQLEQLIKARAEGQSISSTPVR
jgi:hypothetical protein